MVDRDQEFEKIVKKNKQKRLSKAVVTSLIVVVMSLAIVVGSYMFYFNLGPFQGKKMAGVPNNHLKIVEQQKGTLSLLFGVSGGYAYNTNGKEINVYLDYYEKDVRKKHELVGNISQEPSGPLNGELYWGITTTDGGHELDELRLSATNGAGRSQGGYDFKQLKLDTAEGLASSINVFDSGKVEKKKRYIMQTWTTGNSVYVEENSIFDKQLLKENPQTVILYFIIE